MRADYTKERAMDSLPAGYVQAGQQIINTQSGAIYERQADGRLQRTGTASRAQRMALEAGVDPAELRSEADIGALAAQYPLDLDPAWAAAILQRTRGTEEVFALLTALHHFSELDRLTEPREQAERREWLWGACNDLAGVPGWAYRFVQQLTGVELDGAREDG
jgi:hypothetical protein